MIVIDTSIIVKCILLGEDYEEVARKIISLHLHNKETVIVPDLLFYELSNTLATKTKISEKILTQNLKLVQSFQLKTVVPDNNQIIKSAQLANRYKTSFYDMLYTVIASDHKCKLVTADQKFITKTKFKHVIHISQYQ